MSQLNASSCVLISVVEGGKSLVLIGNRSCFLGDDEYLTNGIAPAGTMTAARGVLVPVSDCSTIAIKPEALRSLGDVGAAAVFSFARCLYYSVVD